MASEKRDSSMGNASQLLEVTGLSKTFRHGTKNVVHAVKDVSFNLRQRETIGIVGESGSGKSTTARMIAKLITPTTGRIVLDGIDVTGSDRKAEKAFRTKLQMVFQDPFSSLNPRHSVEDIISAPMRYQRLGKPSEYRKIVKELMERVGLNPDHSSRFPSQFSGGQAQRIGIARALGVDPKVVICDEAVSALDVSVQAQVLELLLSLQRERGFSYIFISHDLAVVKQLSHKILVMKSGEVVESGSATDVLEAPKEQYTKQLLGAVPQLRFKQAMNDQSTRSN